MLSFDSKAARQAWTYAGVILILGTTYMIRKTLLVFAISLMFAYLLYPLVGAIDRRLRWKSQVPALVLPFLFILGLLVGFTWMIKEPASREAKQLFLLIHASKIADWAPLGLPVGEQIVDHSGEVLSLISQLGVGRGLGHVAASLADMLAVPILSFLLLKDGRAIRQQLVELLGIGPASERVLRDAHVLMLEYMRALLLLCLVTLVSFTVVLSLMRVRYGVLLAVLACVLEFIPVVGPFAAAGIILGVGWFTGATSGHLLAIGSFLLGYRVFQDYVLGPIVMRRGVQLHPLVVMFGIFAGADIGGVAGILLSVPVLAMVRLIWYEFRARSTADENSWNVVTV